MIAARERGWKGKFTKPGRIIRPGAIRINGKCPLTPLEVIISLKLLMILAVRKERKIQAMHCFVCSC